MMPGLKWALTTVVAVILLIVTACNNKSGSGNPPPPSCPYGQVPTPAGCAPPGGILPPYGYIPPTNPNGLIQYYASKSDYMSLNDTLIPTSNYNVFLRDALGVCERCTTSVGEALQCDSWVRGFNMMMINLGANLAYGHQMSFYTTPAISQSYFQFAWQFPNIEDFFLTLFTGVPPPSCNQGQFSPYWATDSQYETYNDNKGFVLYANQGPFYSKWNRTKFRLYIPVGKVGDPSFDFQLSVIDKDGKKADLATGTLTRCQSTNCGMF